MTTLPPTCPSCALPLTPSALVWRYGVPRCPRCGTGILPEKDEHGH
jgi:hypothetical protein